jgi:hypothetical protein
LNKLDVNTICSSAYKALKYIKDLQAWARHVARMGEKRNAYRILVGKPEGKRPLGRTRRRWVDNIKMELREIARDVMDWFRLSQDRDQ